MTALAKLVWTIARQGICFNDAMCLIDLRSMPQATARYARLMRRFCQCFVAIALALLAQPHAASANAGAPPDPALLQAQIQRFVLEQSTHLPGDVTVSVHLPLGVSLPECPGFSLSTPSGARAMGRSSVAVRCPALAGTWSLLVPVQIQVLAPYLVTARAIPAGQALAADDLTTRTGDLGALPAGTLTQLEQALGQITRTALTGNQTLRPQLLKVVEVVRNGQSVTVLAGGSGFEVRNTGVALNGGGVGALIRVRLANGQVVNGTATPRGEVRLGS